MLAELDMAYAMTVHKAQGSEYRGVVFVGAPCAPSLMVRGVLYTAITRARELLVIVGDDSAVNKMAERPPQPPLQRPQVAASERRGGKMSFLESLASLLFPPRCAFCGKPGVHGVCSECEKALPYCKTPLHERAEIGACLAPLKYEGIVREALLNYKFHASQSRCTGFGDVLAQAAAEHFGGEFDLVTYVPVSKKRKQERGYDQSYLLARETCRHWGVAPETLLQKTKDNVAQSSLSSREERQKNVVGAYVAVNEDKIKGQRILLIDDILTTGATLREAARVLREAGAEKVICATLAAADED